MSENQSHLNRFKELVGAVREVLIIVIVGALFFFPRFIGRTMDAAGIISFKGLGVELQRSYEESLEVGVQLQTVNNQVDDLSDLVDSLSAELMTCDSNEKVSSLLENVKKSVETSKSTVQEQTEKAMVRAVETKKSLEATISEDVQFYEGWLNIGHFKNSTWKGTQTLDIGDKVGPEDLLMNEPYTLNQDFWLNSGIPKPPFYKIPDAVTILKEGTKVEILKVENVGRNKIWARVRTVN